MLEPLSLVRLVELQARLDGNPRIIQALDRVSCPLADDSSLKRMKESVTVLATWTSGWADQTLATNFKELMKAFIQEAAKAISEQKKLNEQTQN